MSVQPPVGAVLVVGGGIGGMQAALDLAESGIRVHLVEESTAVGGRMAQLDKTFPTNDCSMCVMSPKLVQLGRHPNVEILTGSQVESIGGEMGRFRVRVAQRPRYVRTDRCTACGECTKNCPVELPDEYNMGLTRRRAAFKRYPQAIPGAYAIDKRGRSRCRLGCPAGVSVQGYVALIRQGRFAEALALIRRDNPFPSVCGRVCTHPCEARCVRAEVDEPVAIRDLKRFLCDLERRGRIPRPPPPERADRVESIAVVGAGPAGLTAAWYLRQKGYRVVVFEALPEPGGMLVAGIPAFRLPRDALREEIDVIRAAGVQIRCGTPVGAALPLASLRRDFRAVILAVGAHSSRRMGIPGEDLPGVLPALDFLRAANLGEPVEVRARVAVVGGGNSAFDSARVALRLGAREVTILYRRGREEMPAGEEEIREATAEGIRIEFLAAPVEAVAAAGRVAALRCVRMALGEPDASGRRRPVPIAGSEHTVEADMVLPAIGQDADLRFLPPDLAGSATRDGRLRADPSTLATEMPGVFATGDMVTGASTVIAAIAGGKEAAISVDRFLRGENLSAERGGKLPEAVPPREVIERAERGERPAVPERDPAERARSHDEVRGVMTGEQAVAEASRCLGCGVCCECYACVASCQANAIDHEMVPSEREIEVGSVVLAPGYESFDPTPLGEYGYGSAANVMTGLEFERLLSATGPTKGHVRRPSDAREPRRVAWIQCVGSRDQRIGRGWCSAVCCMHATKQAVIAREHDAELSATIFHIDRRSMGKGFDAYCDRATERSGVRYVRSQISKVDELPDSGDLRMTWVGDDGRPATGDFDLVVLSTGLAPSPAVRDLAARIGVDVGAHGFCSTRTFAPLATSVPGIFVCGVFQGPKDIPETVAQASGAAAAAGGCVAASRGTLVRERPMPPEVAVGDAEPGIGLFVCRCGINIAAVVDVPALVEYAKALPGVAYADEMLFACAQDSQERMKEIIRERGLNRLVVASCSPRTHEPLFQQTVREAGLNKYLFGMTNIREQCSWVHAANREAANVKARDLVRMAVANSRLVRELHERPQPIRRHALVIGGGLAGMTASLALDRLGFPVTLIEREAELGGSLRRLRRTIDGDDVRRRLEALVARVTGQPGITVLRQALVVDVSGFVGNFTTEVMVGPGGYSRTIEHGVIVVATGAREWKPDVHSYGADPRVVTQTELEERLADGGTDAAGLRDVVMIQCVGSRSAERPYCSRVCCQAAIKNALAIKARDPGARVTILYRDVRAYGLLEDHYTRARRAGVIFLRYDEARPPEVVRPPDGEGRDGTADGRLEVRCTLPPRGPDLALPADLVVLAAAVVPEENAELAELLKVPRTADGFFLEAHQKLRPVDFTTEGIFLCGTAHSPKLIDETIAQAEAAAARATTILAREVLQVGGVVSRVDPEKCAACLSCVRACPYQVPRINADGVAEIEPAQCQGCGLCAGECPGKAIDLGHFTDRQILAMSAAFREGAA